MPKIKHTAPSVSREKGERNIDPTLTYFNRRILPLQNPSRFLPAQWRAVVLRQPIATDCKDTLISNIINLDWKIEPKDTDQRDELKSEIEYYTDLFTDNGEIDYTTHIEWICNDALDLPFGAATEVMRVGDTPNGKVVHFQPLDGGTLYPYPNMDWPVYQYLGTADNVQPVFFPRHAIDRIYFNPITDIYRKGWGMAPPERIYIALDMISRGDQYYANLFADTPQAGLLDLLDMDKESAQEWLEAWQEMMVGPDPYKVGVLYEHEKEAKYIPFMRSPAELMFDKGFVLYASLVCAGYGMTLGDIGFSASASGGDTLAGTIRGERKTKRTGQAKLKKKIVAYFNRMLPSYLQFKFVDLDEELNVALGRARLATATAMSSLIKDGVLAPQEARMQILSDGLVTISIPEEIPEDAMPQNAMVAERPSMLGRPVSPSEGGYGEIAARGNLILERAKGVLEVPDVELRRLVYSGAEGVREVLEATLGQQGMTMREDSLPLASNAAEYAIMQGLRNQSWWSLGDTSDIIDDVHGLMSEVFQDILEIAQNELYVRGEIAKSKPLDAKIDRKVAEDLLSECLKEYPKYIVKGIITGLFRFLSDNEIDDIISGDLSGIRVELSNSLDEFIKFISQRIAERVTECLQ